MKKQYFKNFRKEGLPGGPNELIINSEGFILSENGQWEFPGLPTVIPSSDITMEDVPYPVLGISDTGDTQMMYPEEDYQFDGDIVYELPMAQNGGTPEDYNQFLEYNKTAPENRRPDSDWQYGNPRQYDHYGMWDALGKPKNFDEALKNNPNWQPDKYDGMYHGFSTNPNTGVWLKPHVAGEKEQGSTAWMEAKDFYLSGDKNWNSNNFSLQYDPELQRMRYIEKEKKQNGGWLDQLQDGGDLPPMEVNTGLPKYGKKRVLNLKDYTKQNTTSNRFPVVQNPFLRENKINLHLPENHGEEHRRLEVNPYFGGINVEPDFNVYYGGVDADLNLLNKNNNILDLRGGLNTDLVTYPGGSEFTSVNPSIGLSYSHKFAEGGWLNNLPKAQKGNTGKQSANESWGLTQESQLSDLTKGLLNNILHRQAFAESSFNPKVISGDKTSRVGALGMTQIMPETLNEYINKTGDKNINILDPKDAVKVQKWYMQDLLNADFIHKPNQSEKVRMVKALGSYNWGRGNMSKFLGKQKKKGVDIYSDELSWVNDLPVETRDYVNKIVLGTNEKFNQEYKQNSSKYKDYYQNGGWLDNLPKAQPGGTREPIYVDPNDLLGMQRYNAYNDSLNLYKAYRMQDKLMGPGSRVVHSEVIPGEWSIRELLDNRKKKYNSHLRGFFAKDWQSEEDMRRAIPIGDEQNSFDLIKYYKSLGFTDKDIMYHTSPDIVSDKIRPIGTYMDGSFNSPIYKKPVQPYAIRKTEPRTPYSPVQTNPNSTVQLPINNIPLQQIPTIGIGEPTFEGNNAYWKKQDNQLIYQNNDYSNNRNLPISNKPGDRFHQEPSWMVGDDRYYERDGEAYLVPQPKGGWKNKQILDPSSGKWKSKIVKKANGGWLDKL